METLAFATVAIFILLFGLISGRIERTPVTAPMVFVLFGLILSDRVMGIIDLDIENALVDLVAELTLVLILFTDASRIDLKRLRDEHTIPVRLLSFGLPLTMLAGSIAALLLIDILNFWEAVVLAIILSPTDAALGQAVVSSSKVPIRIRQALNVESGLNDGIVLPILLICVSLAGASEGQHSLGYWIQFVAWQVICGPIVGIAVGYLGGQALQWAQQREWVNEAFQDLAAIGLALLAFSGAELVGGNGFLAAFCAGLTLGNTTSKICSCLYEFAEAEGQLLTLLTFMIFGAIMVFPVLPYVDGSILLYAILSLTLIRLLPVWISLIGLDLRLHTIAFVGWFGPRGIASILYILLVLKESHLAHHETIFTVVITTVLSSVYAHGLTAVPWANLYARQIQKMQEKHGDEQMREMEMVSEMPLRLPYKTEPDDSIGFW